MAFSRKRAACITIFFVGLIYSCNSVRRCGHGLDYGEDCTFVPAPPGRTPSCAQPGYTYCEQLDYYPNDLIRHLVEKGEYDFSTLLNDETRDDFGATRPSQGPYGYGPHSLSGTQGISLVSERPTFAAKQPQNQDHYHSNVASNGQFGGSGNGQFSSGQGFQPHHQYFGQTKGNTLSPPGGYVGYYTPSRQQQPYPPPRDLTYLPPSNATTTNYYRGGAFPSGIRLDQYDDFWRGNSYFEVPTRSSSTKGFDGNNGASAYYSGATAGAGTGTGTGARHRQTVRPAGQAGRWSSSTATAAAAVRDDGRQRTPSSFLPPAVTDYNPNEWWQRYMNEPPRSTNVQQQQTSYKSVDSNELKIRALTKRDTPNDKSNKSTFAKNPFVGGRLDRQKRQSNNNAAGGEQLCPTRSQFIMPRAALNKQGNWMYVVNMGQTMEAQYSQLVKSEICVSQQCDGICSLPIGYTAKCEQKYVQKRLVALDQGGQRLYTDIFWFPSCCLCTISNNQT